MKKLLLVLLFVPLVSFGQNNNVNITAGESNAGIMSRMINEAMKDVGNFYIGDGKYKVVQVGSSALVSLKKLNKKCIKQIENICNPLNLSYKLISKEERKGAMGVYPKLANTYQLYNSDGSIYTTDEDKSMGKEAAKKELMELKGFLDLGIITQEEFDKKAESLKKILLGN